MGVPLRVQNSGGPSPTTLQLPALLEPALEQWQRVEVRKYRRPGLETLSKPSPLPCSAVDLEVDAALVDLDRG